MKTKQIRQIGQGFREASLTRARTIDSEHAEALSNIFLNNLSNVENGDLIVPGTLISSEISNNKLLERCYYTEGFLKEAESLFSDFKALEKQIQNDLNNIGQEVKSLLWIVEDESLKTQFNLKDVFSNNSLKSNFDFSDNIIDPKTGLFLKPRDFAATSIGRAGLSSSEHKIHITRFELNSSLLDVEKKLSFIDKEFTNSGDLLVSFIDNSKSFDLYSLFGNTLCLDLDLLAGSTFNSVTFSLSTAQGVTFIGLQYWENEAWESFSDYLIDSNYGETRVLFKPISTSRLRLVFKLWKSEQSLLVEETKEDVFPFNVLKNVRAIEKIVFCISNFKATNNLFSDVSWVTSKEYELEKIKGFYFAPFGRAVPTDLVSVFEEPRANAFIESYCLLECDLNGKTVRDIFPLVNSVAFGPQSEMLFPINKVANCSFIFDFNQDYTVYSSTRGALTIGDDFSFSFDNGLNWVNVLPDDNDYKIEDFRIKIHSVSIGEKFLFSYNLFDNQTLGKNKLFKINNGRISSNSKAKDFKYRFLLVIRNPYDDKRFPLMLDRFVIGAK